MTTTVNPILESIAKLGENPNIVDKRTISQTYQPLGNTVNSSIYFPHEKAQIALGDDTAVIPQEDGSHLLLAAEGIVPYFLEKDPWFAGYSAVMVNISDICAMGGLPVAITDTLHIAHPDAASAVWEGMLAASKAYGVPIVGGHTCYRVSPATLSVSILGKATQNILSSFTARPGDMLLMAIDLGGAYYKEYPFWNASTHTPEAVLRQRIKLPYVIANHNYSTTAKDISMGGILGTLCMLLHSSSVGVELHLENIPKPEGVSWEQWLISFPSYGYLFTASEIKIKSIIALFQSEGIACATIGNITDTPEFWIHHNKERILF